eukprot:1143563-Pelagomonas_calceolata.AAC.9
MMKRIHKFQCSSSQAFKRSLPAYVDHRKSFSADAGWWFWADACMLSPHKVPFDQLLMINVIRKQDLDEGDPFDDAGVCRPRLWLFLSYLVSFGSVVGSVWVLVEHYEQNPDISSAADKWPGVRPRASIKFKRQQGFTSKYLKAGNLSEKSRAATSVTTAATSVCLV